ncbi:hypothetical protein VNO80_03293 [Phaseolus coccineus]|uniref:Uncharacterized protein n=1 Tax=Phaseolus coccineus TaxID=3886 RepID=A0AAN9NSW1_PHACN
MISSDIISLSSLTSSHVDVLQASKRRECWAEYNGPLTEEDRRVFLLSYFLVQDFFFSSYALLLIIRAHPYLFATRLEEGCKLISIYTQSRTQRVFKQRRVWAFSEPCTTPHHTNEFWVSISVRFW